MDQVLSFLSDFWQPFALTLLVFVAAWGVRFITYHALRRWFKTGAGYLATLLQFATVIGGFYAVAIFFGVSPTVILAIVAIFTAGISLASDGFVGNLIAGAVILGNNKFAVGDQVTIAGETGIVHEIGIANVTLQVNTRGWVTIPSSAIAGGTVVNHTKLAVTAGVEMSTTIPMFDAHDITLAQDVIRQTLKEQGLDQGAKVLFDWRGGGMAYSVVVKVRDYPARLRIMSALTQSITERMNAEKLPIGSVLFIKNA